LDTTRRWQSSTAPRARRARITKCSLTSPHAPRKRKRIILAVAWTRKESQNRRRTPWCGLRSEDPELLVPNKLKAEIPKRPQRAFLGINFKFCGNWNPRLDPIDCATETRVIKAMRRRIALQSTACEIYARCPFRFAPAFGVRGRPRAAFGNYMYDGSI
jgi:hypothetical protein